MICGIKWIILVLSLHLDVKRHLNDHTCMQVLQSIIKFLGSRSGLHMDLISYQSIFSWLEPCVWVLQCVCVICTLSHKHMHACVRIFKGDVWLLWLYPTGRPEVAGLAASQMTKYLAGEEAAHTDDAEDVKDGRAHDGPHPHVTFGNKHPWEENNTHRIIPQQSGLMIVCHLTFTAAARHSHSCQNTCK